MPPESNIGRMLATKQLVHDLRSRDSPPVIAHGPAAVAGVELGGIRIGAVRADAAKTRRWSAPSSCGATKFAPFADKQIDLVENFAAQAVIAIENARLLTELRESPGSQQTATAEVLRRDLVRRRASSSRCSRSMLANAVRICAADQGRLWRCEGGAFVPVAARGMPASLSDIEPTVSCASGRRTLCRSVPNGRHVHIPDAQQRKAISHATPTSSPPWTKRHIGSALFVPMVRDGEVIGAFSLNRSDIQPFTNKHIELVENFAAQAVIAIENARLLTELRGRTRDLQESLEYQTATSDVLKVISGSNSNLEAVLQAVVTTAYRLCRADYAVIFRNEGDVYRWTAGHGLAPEYEARERRAEIHPGAGTLVGRAASEGRAVQIADALADPLYEAKDDARTIGARAMLGVPLLREGLPIGVIGLARNRVEAFADKEVELVTTFADQAVIAIENARLLTELRESLDRQTATAEVLQVINRSPGNLAPVFDAMLEKALRLCEASFGLLHTFDGGRFHLAVRGIGPRRGGLFANGCPIAGSAWTNWSVALRRCHIADVVDTDAYRCRSRLLA